MGLEIERRFIAKQIELSPMEGSHIEQAYLSFDPTVRIRLMKSRFSDQVAYLTIKGPGKLSRAEYEYSIPPRDGQELWIMASKNGTIDKTRWHLKVGDHVWDYDVFHGVHSGLILAEVELKHVDEKFKMPEWAGLEVTGDSSYSNANLCRRGPIYVFENEVRDDLGMPQIDRYPYLHRKEVCDCTPSFVEFNDNHAIDCPTRRQ